LRQPITQTANAEVGHWPGTHSKGAGSAAAARVRPDLWQTALIIGVGLAGVVWIVVLINQAGTDQPGLRATLACWTTVPYIVAGALAWRRRPDSRLGFLMVIAGYVVVLTFLSWSSNDILITVAEVFDLAPPLMFLIVFLTYPSGRVHTTAERVVITVAGVAAALTFVYLPLGYDETLLTVNAQWPELAQGIQDAQLVLMAAALMAGVGLLIGRRIGSPRPLRRWFGYLVDSFSVVLLILAVLYVVHVSAWNVNTESLRLVMFGLVGVAPLVFLIGLIDERLGRASIADLMAGSTVTLGPAELQDGVRRSLRDPSARVIYWIPDFDSYADVEGKSVELDDLTDASLTPVGDGEHPMALLIHDPALDYETTLLSLVAAATSMLIHKAQLEVELRARVDELRGSRMRILDAEQRQRRRLERDLHDGAQQRLLALSLSLSEIESQIGDDDDLRARVDEARSEVAASLQELRNLAHGIHPAALIDHGVAVALESLATRAPIPVEVTTVPLEGISPAAELTAFYLVSEALANVAKHSQASTATIDLEIDGDILVVEITDDGVGGADTRGGSGLRGLADRVEAVGGRFMVWSPAGDGTRLRAEIPCT
jgi:signal transduction histidine kinase